MALMRYAAKRAAKHRKQEIWWPGEMIVEVASHVSTPWNILNMCLIVSLWTPNGFLNSDQIDFLKNKQALALLLPFLYTSVELKTVRRCDECLERLIGQPNVARYVRSLILRPRGYVDDDASHTSLCDERDIAIALNLVIPHLHCLCRFEWHGFDMPTDHIWATLRQQYV